jgi:V/A-type H+-transporting ATPase subunit I
VLFYECDSDENYVWGVFFMPEMYKTEIDAVSMSFHFERVYLPDSFEGTPDEAYQEAEKKIKQLEDEDASLTDRLQSTLARHRKKLTDAYIALESYCENFDIRKYAVCTKELKGGDETTEYYILYGWMSYQDAAKLESEIADDPKIHVMEEDVSTDLSADPPTRLKNPKIFKPFEMFVEMYGLPAYNEMDPTMFIALTYTLMFGIMFGDVGQGICLVVGGFLLYHFKKMNLAAIVSLAGIWSTVFGFMYGSIFGFEDILTPVWMRPMDNIMTTLMLAIGFGMVLILIAMIINIVNAIRAKEPGRLLFDQSGVAGLICYGCAATCIVLYETGHALPATSILAVAVGIPLVAIFLKEPLSNLV